MNLFTKQDLINMVNELPDDAVIAGYSYNVGEQCDIESICAEIESPDTPADFDLPDNVTHLLMVD